MVDGNLQRDGFCMLRDAVPAAAVQQLLRVFDHAFVDDTESVRARSSRGHVYAARNLIRSIPEVTSVWQSDGLLRFLREHLVVDLVKGPSASGSLTRSTTLEFGLVRALFFDKPPDRTWALAWHKDTSIAVKDNSIASISFSRPTTKAGVPHLIACDEVLQQMLTLRVHLDEVTDENGPLRVIPGSHVSSASEGDGLDVAVDIHASAGDVLAMRPLISHSSGSSKPGTQRHLRILHLEFAGSANLPDAVEWHDFVRPSSSQTSAP